jgi:DNA (cytosine-5)-methyltransferase 1
MMNVLSLFAGIGGLELGLERAGMTVVGQVEINPFCRSVLDKHWPGVPRHDDVRTATQWWDSQPRPVVDLICGGFPCQDISHAGKRAGITGPKSSLWGAMLDTIRHLRPRYVLVENVSALAIRGLDTVLADLAGIGFDAEWATLRASDFGAPHNRERLYILAHPAGIDGIGRNLLAGGGIGRSPLETGELSGLEASARRRAASEWLEREPAVARLAHGIPQQMDRLTALGNAVVPQVSQYIGGQLMDYVSKAVA